MTAETTLIFDVANLDRLASAMSKLLSRKHHLLITASYFSDWIEDGMVNINDTSASIRVSEIDDNISDLCQSAVVKTTKTVRKARVGTLKVSRREPDLIDFVSIAEQFKC